MDAEYADWKLGLLFAVILTVFGVIAMVSWRKSAERAIASGLFLQGVILLFVVASAALHHAVNVQLGGLIVLTLLLIQSIISLCPLSNDVNSEEPSS